MFLAGILVGDAGLPGERAVKGFVGSLAGLAEVVAFVVLGLSVDLASIGHAHRLWIGLGIAALLIVAIRPVLVGLLLWPVRLARGERAFVLFAGLKGAVPILLGTYVLAEGAHRATDVYDVIFVVVLVSVVVQGGLVPAAARILHVPMRAAGAGAPED